MNTPNLSMTRRDKRSPSTSGRVPSPVLSDVVALSNFVQPNLPAPITPDARRAMIAEAAFYLAERRNFEPGREMDDWLAAEREIERRLNEPSAH